MVEIIMESLVEVMATLLLMLIGILGTWLTMKLGKKEELAAINAAQQEVIAMAQLTVEELQQTTVEELKKAREDGKLTKAEIDMLRSLLLSGVKKKMSDPTANLLAAAAVDLNALIRGAGESWIAELKKE